MDRLLALLDTTTLATDVVAFIPQVVAALIILLVFWATFRLTRRPLAALLERAGLHQTLVTMIVGNLYRTAIMIFGIVMAADQIGINVGTAVAGIGVAGIAVGFAAQDSLANFISGFLIFIDKPFEVGDWITVSDKYGEVSNITMRTTRIRTRRNTYVVIPNKTIIDSVLDNHSKHGITRVDVPVGIAYKEHIPHARAVILEAIAGADGVQPAPPPEVVVTKLGDSSVDLEVRVWIDDAGHERPVHCRVLEVSKLALDAAGIEIPFPHLQLFVEEIEDRVWQKAARFAPAMLAPGARPAPEGPGA